MSLAVDVVSTFPPPDSHGLLEGFKRRATTPDLVGTAVLCPNVRSLPPRSLPGRRRVGGVSRFVTRWRRDAGRLQYSDRATIYPG
jgi:hypothetical protein